MVGDYLSGWHTMSLNAPTGMMKPLYPLLIGGTEYANTDFATETQSESPFDSDDRDAVIRSIFMMRDFSGTAPLITIRDHDGDKIYFQGLPSVAVPICMPDVNILVPGGFRVDVTGQPYAYIYYEINVKG